jgi:hypothetical protein
MKGNVEPTLATLHPRKKPWPRPKTRLMSWYNYFFCFFAGMFLANVVPHFVHGISGDPFPTPFAHPPGKGLSSATTNVVWALVNLIVGYVFCRVGKVSSGGNLALAVFFAGITALSTWLSVLFAKIRLANRSRKATHSNSFLV